MELSSYISSNLPAELWDQILGFLPIKDLVKIKSVNKFFFNLVASNKGFKIKIFLYKYRESYYDLDDQISYLAARGQVESLKYLYNNSSDARRYMKIGSLHRCAVNVWNYEKASVRSRLRVIKWVIKTFNLTKENLFWNGYKSNDIFLCAAREGFLKILKWLHSTFNLAREYVVEQGNSAFIAAARRGHLNILKWLHSTFKLTRYDVIAEDNRALNFAIEHGKSKVLKWLYHTFKLTKEDVMYGDIYSSGHNYKTLVYHGKLNDIKWLYFTFGFTEEDIEDFYRAVKYQANNGNNQPKILQWLDSNFS